MSNPLTEAREWLQGVLTAALAASSADSVKVYPIMPATPTAPCVVISAGAPWISAGTLARTKVNLVASILARSTSGNDESARKLEELAWIVVRALPDHGPVEPITLDSIGESELYRIDVPISVYVEDDDKKAS
jgi:hypothetical protein